MSDDPPRPATPNEVVRAGEPAGAPPEGEDSLFNRVMLTAEAQIEPGGATQPQDKPEIGKHGVKHLGAIAELSSPADWNLTLRQERSIGYVYGWTPKGRPDVSLTVDSRAQPLSTADAQALKNILDLDVGTVLTREQIDSLQGALREKADANVFRMDSAVVREIDGKKVLAIRGEFTDQKVSTEALLIPTSADASYFQTVSYTAPTKDFARFGEAPGKSLDGVRLR